jgi:hypothetical protein
MYLITSKSTITYEVLTNLTEPGNMQKDAVIITIRIYYNIMQALVASVVGQASAH